MGWNIGGSMALLNMHVIDLFKVLGILQVSLFILLFLVILAFTFYQDIMTKIKLKEQNQIQEDLLQFKNLSASKQRFLKRRTERVFKVFYDLEQSEAITAHEDCVLILKTLFLPVLANYVHAKQWYKRHLAAMILQLKNKYMPETEIDGEYLKKLLQDDTPLVIINAAMAVCYQPTLLLVNMLIDNFAAERRSQYELLRLILKDAALQIAPIVVERLNSETEPQVKSLCYRILTDLPKLELHVPSLKEDITSENLDVCLAAIAYIAYSEHRDYKGLLVKSLSHPAWQVRARAAKLIGRIHDPQLATALEPILSDKLWWVRFRAAEALLQLGDPGMSILTRQTDPYAKEIASQQIKLQQLRTGK